MISASEVKVLLVESERSANVAMERALCSRESVKAVWLAWEAAFKRRVLSLQRLAVRCCQRERRHHDSPEPSPSVMVDTGRLRGSL